MYLNTNTSDEIDGDMDDMNDMDADIDMEASMGGMGDMQSMPEMFMNVSFEELFHVDKGMLGQLKGTLSTETKMSGVSMKTTTNVTIIRK